MNRNMYSIILFSIILTGCQQSANDKPFNNDFFCGSCQQFSIDKDIDCCSHVGFFAGERTFGEYTVTAYRVPYGLQPSFPKDLGSFEILKSGKRVFLKYGWDFSIGSNFSLDEPKFNLIGGDLTGNGKANLVVYEWTGGNNCYHTMYLFEIDEEFKEIARIDSRNDLPEFTDMDGDSVPEVLVYDPSYSCWTIGLADSPAPKVILKWSEENCYTVATDIMHHSSLCIQKLEEEAAVFRKSGRWTSGPGSKYSRYYIPTGFFDRPLKLMYTGHEDLGWKFIKTAWTNKFPIDQELLEELRERMASSPYWIQLQK